MKKKFDFSKIEKKWQKAWQKEGVYEPSMAKAAKKKFYNLMMFPYPSAEGLHVGNMYAFTGSDIYGRFKRMQGNDVFEPIGLDGFGIHSENYAMKIGAHPMTQAGVSSKRFYKQLEEIGNGFAWREKLETYDPNYYRWTQWIFTKLFKAGLAYRKKQAVNWCPSCKTVLADEQVINGKCERCSTVAIKKDLEQWFFRITKYADKLLANLGKLDWSEKVKIAQRNWIGKSEGAELYFDIRCAKKPNFVLLHGFKRSPKRNFFPWLKAELEARGYAVQVPALPHPAAGNVAEQVGFVLKNAHFDFDTVLLGHSLGAVVALRVVERLSSPIRKLILAGGFVNPDFNDHPRPFAKKSDWKFDFARIKKSASEIAVLQDINDPIVGAERAHELERALGVAANFFEAEDVHICGKREPKVLDAALGRVAVFTTRPDTLFGATYVVLAPEHPLVKNLESRIKNKEEVKKYVADAKKKSEEERLAEDKDPSTGSGQAPSTDSASSLQAGSGQAPSTGSGQGKTGV
ncbi:MAG: alpha/beta fold hydrolase, partial [Patescibacteria group bacterium]